MTAPKGPRHGSSFDYYLDEDLSAIMTPEELMRFNEWIVGQTGGIIDGQFAIYAWDVERFLDNIRKGHKLRFD